MKRRTDLFWTLLLLLLAAFTLTGCSAGNAADDDPVLATYRDHEVRKSLVESEKKNAISADGQTISDREAVDHILRNLVMLDEAERLGLSVTQEEIDYELKGQKQNYEDEGIRKIVDNYCEENGLTLDEYYAAVEEELPRMILRQKLRDMLGQKYCEEQGLEFTKVNPPKQMTEYVEAYLNGLLDTYSAEITYHLGN